MKRSLMFSFSSCSRIKFRISLNVLCNWLKILDCFRRPDYFVVHLLNRFSTSSCETVPSFSALSIPLWIFSMTYRWYWISSIVQLSGSFLSNDWTSFFAVFIAPSFLFIWSSLLLSILYTFYHGPCQIHPHYIQRTSLYISSSTPFFCILEVSVLNCKAWSNATQCAFST